MSSSITAPSKVRVTRSCPKASGSSSNPSRRRRGPRPSGCALPRSGRPDRPGGFEGREERDRPARLAPRRNTDGEALALREQGRSYAAIARTLGLKRATDARAAFLRALRAAPEDERTQIVRRESERLDQLEVRIRTRDAAAPDKLERRLEALAALRRGLD